MFPGNFTERMALVGPVQFLNHFASQVSDLGKPCPAEYAMQTKIISLGKQHNTLQSPYGSGALEALIFGNLSPLQWLFSTFPLNFGQFCRRFRQEQLQCRAMLVYWTASTHVRSSVFPPLQILTNDRRGLRSSSKIDERNWKLTNDVYKSNYIFRSNEIDKMNH